MKCPFCGSHVQHNQEALSDLDMFKCSNSFCISKELIIKIDED